jgi:hypothetical protein
VVRDKGNNRIEIPAYKVVLSLGVRVLKERAEELRGLAKEFYMIGDCIKPRNLMYAIHNALNITAEM